MAERAYTAEFAEQVARATADIEHLALHAGFERIELSHRESATLGFAEPSGLWLDAPGDGEVHGGRFGRTFRKHAGATELGAFSAAVATAVDRAERGDTWAAIPVMAVSSGLYLGLMSGERESLAEVARAAVRTDRRAALWRLWEPRNWRPHMLACAAACITDDASAVDTAWMALDRYSWGCPQIAATLRLIDADFESAAGARLDAAEVSDDVWPRPLDRYCLDAKSRGALSAMLGRDSGEPESEGARLAERWLERVEAFLGAGT